ncbi:MAG TPA: RNA polymerase sigma factor [Thermoanaerobaculia bacterium]|nr:RNA polymerase sigma factor [Thermoanaerobaculia bacterium]
MNLNVTTVERAMAGDRQAFGELVADCWTSLVRLARGVVGDADAEDAVQDALVLAGEKLGQLRRPEKFLAWVRRLVVRTCLRQQRRRRGWRFLPLLADAPLPDPAASAPDTDLDSGLDVERMLAVLPTRQRTVLYLTAVEGLSDGEIAELLAVTAGTVRSLRRHGRRRLQTRYAHLFQGRLSLEGAPR